jgi:hypothetical protein
MVRNLALGSGNTGAKEPFLIAPFRCDRFVWFSIKHDLDRLRIWPKDPDLHVIADLVRTQHAERVRMKASDKSGDLISRDVSNLERFHYPELMPQIALSS